MVLSDRYVGRTVAVGQAGLLRLGFGRRVWGLGFGYVGLGLHSRPQRQPTRHTNVFQPAL
jgi:hypothetical protein